MSDDTPAGDFDFDSVFASPMEKLRDPAVAAAMARTLASLDLPRPLTQAEIDSKWDEIYDLVHDSLDQAFPGGRITKGALVHVMARLYYLGRFPDQPGHNKELMRDFIRDDLPGLRSAR